MSEVETKTPLKPITDVSVFTAGTIPVAEMTKPKYTNKLSTAEQAKRTYMDKFVAAIPVGGNRAGTLNIPEGSSGRTVMGLIRGACNRAELAFEMVHNQDKNQVEVKITGKAAPKVVAEAAA